MDVEIPEGVTSIEDGAFEGKGLTSVTFPNSVVDIGANAFENNSLTSLTVPESVTDIGDGAFAGNLNLGQIYIPNPNASVGTDAFPNGYDLEGVMACFEFDSTDSNQINDYYDNENDDANNPACSRDMVIPDGVTHIAEDAFKDKGLTSVEISTTVTDIEANAFSGNAFSSLVYIPNESATVDASAFDSSVIVATEGTDSCFVRDANDITILIAFPCSTGTTIEIPSDIVSIEDGVFENKGLTSVTFPSALESIGNDAFKDNDLMDLTLPATITDIGDNAFDGNSNLAWTYIPSSSASVGTDAFPNGHAVVSNFYCFEFDTTDPNKIENYYDNENNDSNAPACSRDVVIPQGVREIGSYAFSTNSLTSVDIPNSVTHIGRSAFQSNSFNAVDIPNSVVSIGDFAFLSSSLNSVTISNGTTSIGDSAFKSNLLRSVIIPDSVVIIKGSAFSHNRLTSVIIGSGVTQIKSYAFANNSGSPGLRDACIEANSEDVTVDSTAFASTVTLTYDADQDCSN